MIILNNIIWLYSNIIIFSKIVIKNKDILLNLKLSPDDKKLLKKRIRIEHTNSHLKQYKRLSWSVDHSKSGRKSSNGTELCSG